MRTLAIAILALAVCGVGLAQEWEIGGSGGVGIFKNATVSNGTTSATAGFATGPAFGAIIGQNLYKHIGGEFRYMFQMSDLKVSGNGQDLKFSGQEHAFHYDVLLYASGPDANVRPYLSVGGGAMVYRGTGKPTESQGTLGTLAALTQTNQVRPLITFGGGFKAKLKGRAYLYAEVRDYLTPFPTEVVAPVPPAKISGWLHDFVPSIGITFSF